MTETAEEFIARKNKEFENHKTKTIKIKDIGRKGRHLWIREAWCFMPQASYAEKVFVIERFRNGGLEGESAFWKPKANEIQYRIGYYIVGRIGNKNKKWTWGQYCPFIPKEDLDKLLTLARKNKGIL